MNEQEPVAWQYRMRGVNAVDWQPWQTICYEPQGPESASFEMRPLFAIQSDAAAIITRLRQELAAEAINNDLLIEQKDAEIAKWRDTALAHKENYDIINGSLREEVARLTAERDEKVLLNNQLADYLGNAEEQLAHWKNNHDNRVKAARMLIERTDLPLERIAAYAHYVRIQEQLALTETKFEALCKDFDRRNELVESLRKSLHGMTDLWVSVCRSQGWEPDHLSAFPGAIKTLAEIDAARKEGE